MRRLGAQRESIIGIERCGRAIALLALAGWCVMARAVEPVSVDDLARAYAASSAMEQETPGAHPYRAGRFDGFLAALADRMQRTGEACFPSCICQLREQFDPILVKALMAPRLDPRQPAERWLTGLLADAFPCAGAVSGQ